jgi:hypothetical protein
MRYEEMKETKKNGDVVLPTVMSEVGVAASPVVDGSRKLECSKDNPKPVLVNREVELFFKESDFTWLVFFSEPVMVQCVMVKATQDVVSATGGEPKTNFGIQLQVVGREDDVDDHDRPFFIRIALSKYCTSNWNPIYCHQEQMHPYALNLGQGRYADLLRDHSAFFPGPDTSFDYAIDDDSKEISLSFDWDVQDMTKYSRAVEYTNTDADLIVFALPHHLDLMGMQNAPGYLPWCAHSLIGPACLLAGSTWEMTERIPSIGLRAPRPMAPWVIGRVAKSLKDDLQFKIPKYFRSGRGDTCTLCRAAIYFVWSINSHCRLRSQTSRAKQLQNLVEFF